MCKLQVLLPLIALLAAPAWAGEAAGPAHAKQTAAQAEPPATPGIEGDIQSRIDAELLADIQQKSGITVIYQTARMIKPRAVPAEDELRLARLEAE
jgi:hypothetical protein